MTWRDEYRVGIPLLDDQHRNLLDVINRLHQGVSTPGQDREALFRDAARQCVAYVQEHFATEEQYLLDHPYPGYDTQRRAHAAFSQRLLENVHRFEKGDRLAPNRLVAFLAEWLVSHIAFEDKKYGDFFRSQLT